MDTEESKAVTDGNQVVSDTDNVGGGEQERQRTTDTPDTRSEPEGDGGESQTRANKSGSAMAGARATDGRKGSNGPPCAHETVQLMYDMVKHEREQLDKHNRRWLYLLSTVVVVGLFVARFLFGEQSADTAKKLEVKIDNKVQDATKKIEGKIREEIGNRFEKKFGGFEKTLRKFVGEVTKVRQASDRFNRQKTKEICYIVDMMYFANRRLLSKQDVDRYAKVWSSLKCSQLLKKGSSSIGK